MIELLKQLGDEGRLTTDEIFEILKYFINRLEEDGIQTRLCMMPGDIRYYIHHSTDSHDAVIKNKIRDQVMESFKY